MKTIKFVLLLLPISLIFIGCLQPPVYSDTPVIEYISINKNIIRQGSAMAVADTLIVTFSYTDGDGDLSGSEEGEEGKKDVFFTDSRSGASSIFGIPTIAEEGAANGISGEITIRIPSKTPQNICCNYLNGDNSCDSHPGEQDTVIYSIQIRDRALNYSNIIETEPIYILCD